MKFLWPVFAFLLVISSRLNGAVHAPDDTFNVATFGAKGDGQNDERAAIQKAIDAAIASGTNAIVSFDRGKIYRLGKQDADVAALRIGGASGLTLSGNGATLVAHPSNRQLTIFDSKQVVIRDLVLDYNPLPFTQARVTELALARGAIRFRVEPDYDDPSVGAGDVYPDFKNSDTVFLDGATRAFTHDWGRISGITALENHVFEARFHSSNLEKRFARLKVGDFIAVKRPFPKVSPQRDGQGRFLSAASANIYITFSEGVRLERVVSYAAPQMTFLASGSEAVVLDGCRIVRKPGTNRLIASNSDGAHFKSLTVMPQVLNSTFEALMDDSVNIKISSEVVQEVRGQRVRLTHGDILTDDIVIQPGQYLSFVSGSNKWHLGYARVAAVQRVGYRETWVTLEAAVVGLVAGDLAFLRPETDAVVSRCEFRSQLKTALVVHGPPTVISNCAFAGVAYGLHVFFNSRAEGPPPFGIRLNNCEFLRPSAAAVALYLPATNSVPPGIPSLIADQCRVTIGGNRGLVLSAINQGKIELRNWLVTVEDDRTRDDLIKSRNCARIEETNVTFERPQARGSGISAAEQRAGWKMLWDGKSSEGWRSVDSEAFPSNGWSIKDGVLTVKENHGKPSAGDIITRQRYSNFEMTAEFRIVAGANSGIKIFAQTNVSPFDKQTGKPTAAVAAVGMEFQILDDEKHPDAKLGRDGNRTIGSLYDLVPAPKDKVVLPVGEWNQARILSRGQHVEFWLNGQKMIECERGTPEFHAAVAASKFRNIPSFGEWADGHILLQDHGNEVSFRNLRIRELPAKATDGSSTSSAGR